MQLTVHEALIFKLLYPSINCLDVGASLDNLEDTDSYLGCVEIVAFSEGESRWAALLREPQEAGSTRCASPDPDRDARNATKLHHPYFD
jgi:hypothetical protein